MRSSTVLACAVLALLPGVARADIAKVVPTGTTRTIDFFASLHPDCSSTGTPTVRLIDGPSKGLITTERARDYLPFPKGNVRSRCNAHRVSGLRMMYRSADNFVGTDRVRILILSGSGESREAIYSIQVR